MKKIYCLIITIMLCNCGPVTPEQCEEDCFDCDESGCVAMGDCLCDCNLRCRNGG